MTTPWVAGRRGSAAAAEGYGFKLIKEFRDARLGATSPDGKRMCLVFDRTPIKTLYVRPDGSATAGFKPQGNECSVLSVGGWERVCSFQLRGNVSTFCLLPNGTVYASSFMMGVPGPVTEQHALIDGKTGKLTERLESGASSASIADEAAVNHSLLAIRGRRELVKLDLPAFAEVQAVELGVKRREALLFNTTLVVTGDQKVVCYGVDHSVVCRRVDDLSVVWTGSVTPELHLTEKCIAISADGGTVAIAPWNADTAPRRFYTAFFDAKTGSEVARWGMVDGSDGLALSADGGLVAIGGYNYDGPDVVVFVRVYDRIEEREVATVVHDRIGPGRHRLLNALWTNIYFTPDRGLMLTSSNNKTKIWSVGEGR